MLDLKFVRENLDFVDSEIKNRKGDFDKGTFETLDKKRRDLIGKEEVLQQERNAKSKQVGEMMKAGNKDEAEDLKARVREINEQLEGLTSDRESVDAEMKEVLMHVPNLAHESVPVGEDEDENVEVRRNGTPRKFDFEYKAHWDIGADLGIIDCDRGVKLAESRFYCLGGAGARLERALISFMLDTHTSRGYKEWWVPALANKRTLTGTAQLPKFEEDLYKTTEGLYLIPTAEVQLTNLHANETLNVSELPKKYCAFTPCFREEAGSAGRDTRGIIRVHQFSKVEMVKITTPESGFDELESMTADAENILSTLGLPYRVITLCTGDMGFSAAKTYDVEVWMPSYDGYKEISSCSCCTDFQARRAGIRYKDPDKFKGSRLCYTLNGSGVAVGRCMAAIIENYQNEDGTVTVPEALVPYMGGMTKIESQI